MQHEGLCRVAAIYIYTYVERERGSERERDRYNILAFANVECCGTMVAVPRVGGFGKRFGCAGLVQGQQSLRDLTAYRLLITKKC
jgi:hypothetical protein